MADMNEIATHSDIEAARLRVVRWIIAMFVVQLAATLILAWVFSG